MSEYTWTLRTVTHFNGRVSSLWRWVKPLQIFLPFTGGQKLRAAGHTSNETHSLDSRSVRGPPLDAGAKCKTTGKGVTICRCVALCPGRTDAWTQPSQSQSTYSNLQVPVKFVVSEPYSSNCFTLSSLSPAHIYSLSTTTVFFYTHGEWERGSYCSVARQSRNVPALQQ